MNMAMGGTFCNNINIYYINIHRKYHLTVLFNLTMLYLQCHKIGLIIGLLKFIYSKNCTLKYHIENLQKEI